MQVCGTLGGEGGEEGEFAILQQHADSLDESLRTVLHEIEQLREKWAESQAAIGERESRLSRLGEERSRLSTEIEVLQERTTGLEHLLEDKDNKVSLQPVRSGTKERVNHPSTAAGRQPPAHHQPAPAGPAMCSWRLRQGCDGKAGSCHSDAGAGG